MYIENIFPIEFQGCAFRWGRENEWEDIENTSVLRINPSIINSKYFVKGWRGIPRCTKNLL